MVTKIGRLIMCIPPAGRLPYRAKLSRL